MKMLNKLMGNLGPMKEAMDNAKKKLDTITVKGEAEGGLVSVYANGNRKITEVNINQKLMDDGDKEAIEAHHHIITSSHHHISTLAHHHIITLAHHHISTSSHHHISTLAHHHISTSSH
jgi:DNA-binding YbaB/EbfC family protein